MGADAHAVQVPDRRGIAGRAGRRSRGQLEKVREDIEYARPGDLRDVAPIGVVGGGKCGRSLRGGAVDGEEAGESAAEERGDAGAANGGRVPKHDGYNLRTPPDAC